MSKTPSLPFVSASSLLDEVSVNVYDESQADDDAYIIVSFRREFYTAASAHLTVDLARSFHAQLGQILEARDARVGS